MNAIVEAYREHDRAIRSLSVEYRVTTSALGAPRDIVRYLNLPYLASTHESFAYKGDMRHYTLSHPNDGVYEHLVDREADGSPVQVRVVPGVENATNGTLVFTLDGKKQWRRHPAGIISLPERQKGSDEGQFGQMYLKTVLRAVPDVFENDDLRYRYSLAGLADHSLLSLARQHETIGGVECAVLEWVDERENQGPEGLTFHFHNTVWCDPALGYAVRQHDVRLDDKRTLIRHVVFDDFTNVAPGVWYPKHVTIDQCASPQRASREILGTPLIRTELVVDNVSANNVSDDIFTPEVQPGTVVADARYLKDGQPINYVQPASEAELERTIAEIMTDDSQGQPPARRPVSLRMLLAVNLVIFAAVAWFVWWKRRSAA